MRSQDTSAAYDDPLAAWIDRREERPDTLRPWPAEALHAALGRAGEPPRIGDPLPPFWSHLYFLETARRGALGRDGHPARGQGVQPPVELPRRMWAGGRLRFQRPAPIGAEARRVSRIAEIRRKQGRSGPLVFVTLLHEIYVRDGRRGAAGDAPAIVEAQELVYRQDPPEGSEIQRPEGPPPRTDEVWRRAWTADPVLLFRYSALTFNGHRIHYDLDYCRRVEGYMGLVVHGPLLVTLMLDLAREFGPDRPLAALRYRARAPLFDTEAFEVCGKPYTRQNESGDEVDGADLWVRSAGDSRRLVMEAAIDYKPVAAG